ncbi:4-oxalocrotonate tautomerase [Leucobacter sp. UCD-THU]|uniref:4-oxalocrotonate tautomerase n=1 Tax=Leucobacter muris TaxID=1935379 RepID=A0ABX5QI28_9MICO|nr:MULTISPECIES: tautomerase family protein [Leucobacter]EYT55223.1 4-oxalocrotonate tautomerase [Leucobacter sp. UCD-THU]QAB18685.1 4-oxalocrotonate tautomerase [Leucobacter muris]
MPYIQVFEAQQRSSEEAGRIVRAVTEAYAQSAEIPAAKVQVVLSAIPRDHWGVGGKTLEAQDEEARS